MNLESAREIKEEALARFVAVPGADAFALEGRSRWVGVRAGALFRSVARRSALGDDQGPSETIGLGVALADKGECKLAVRYPWLDRSRAPHLDELTALAQGEIDVEWTGPIVAQGFPVPGPRQRTRPLTVGLSVGHKDVTAGTICAFVRRGGGAPELLSCNHVLADCDRASANDPILQPGVADGGTPADTIGRLAGAIPLDRAGVNAVDCAVASLATGVDADPTTLAGYGGLAGLVDRGWYGPQAVGEPVAKIGRTTGATEGLVTVISFAQFVNYRGFGRCWFDELIEVRGETGLFSDGGDSGSLVFGRADRRGLGMVIAGTDTRSYVTRLDTVLSRLGAELAI
jgi:hypothetical protein